MKGDHVLCLLKEIIKHFEHQNQTLTS